MKLVVYIINPEDYANGEYSHALSCTTRAHWQFWRGKVLNEDYIYLAEVDVEMDSVSRDCAASAATKALSKRMEDIRAKTDAELTVLDNRINRMLSLPGAVK